MPTLQRIIPAHAKTQSKLDFKAPSKCVTQASTDSLQKLPNIAKGQFCSSQLLNASSQISSTAYKKNLHYSLAMNSQKDSSVVTYQPNQSLPIKQPLQQQPHKLVNFPKLNPTQNKTPVKQEKHHNTSKEKSVSKDSNSKRKSKHALNHQPKFSPDHY